MLLDPEGGKTITVSEQVSRCDYAPLEGKQLQSCITEGYLRGSLTAKDGKVLEKNHGQYLKRGEFMRI